MCDEIKRKMMTGCGLDTTVCILGETWGSDNTMMGIYSLAE
jgi:hypothetical protein